MAHGQFDIHAERLRGNLLCVRFAHLIFDQDCSEKSASKRVRRGSALGFSRIGCHVTTDPESTHHSHASHESIEGTRLHDIAVRPTGIARGHVGRDIGSGEDRDGDRGKPRIGSQLSQKNVATLFAEVPV